ncbi:MAG: DUF2911 domain-containing protein [Lewinella sp.]|nr:DUF2911 domain-containing protein [Lewinella sp.]
MVMKATRFLLLIAVFCFGLSAVLSAQRDKSTRPSPPAQTNATLGDLTIAIDYSQPSVKGREIWGGLVPYGEVWRTGANEATTFEVNADVQIQGKTLPAGKYSLFSIPGEEEWVFIFNKVPNQWGAFKYNPADDVLRITAKPGKAPVFTEKMSFEVAAKGDRMAWVNLIWADLAIGFGIEPMAK